MFRKETINKYFEITIDEDKIATHWDLWFCQGKGFATYLMAFGKADSTDEAIKIARKQAHKLAAKYGYQR